MCRKVLLASDALQVCPICGLIAKPRVSGDADHALQPGSSVACDGGVSIHDLVDLLTAASKEAGDLLLGQALLKDPLFQLLLRGDGVVGPSHGSSWQW